MSRQYKKSKSSSFVRRLGTLYSDKSGGVLVYAALLMPILVGVAGLAVDVSIWYANKRFTQNAVDAAASTAALELLRMASQEETFDVSYTQDQKTIRIHEVAIEVAELNGYNVGRGDTIEVYWPPISGPATGDLNFVEALIDTPASASFSATFWPGAFDISSRAVARIDVVDACVWALHPSKKGAVTVNGTAKVMLNCGVFSNSDDGDSITLKGGGCLEASEITVVGGYDDSGLKISCSPSPFREDAGMMPDPFETFEPEDYPGCSSNSKIKVNSGETLNLGPGTYCGGISVTGGTLNFVPDGDDNNRFTFVGSGIEIAADSIVNGDGIFIHMTESTSATHSFMITGQADVNISAATSGPFANMLFYSDRTSPSIITHTLAGGATMYFDGVFYAPSTGIKYAGGSAANSGAVMIIADTITFTGNSHFNGIAGTPLQLNPNLISASIVE